MKNKTRFSIVCSITSRYLLVLIFFVLGISSLSGCVKESDFKELEDRVSQLEAKIDEKETEENNIVHSNDLNTNNEVTNNEQASLESVQDSSLYSYVISDKTPEEIKSIVFELIDHLPNSGDTIEIYNDSFDVKPCSAELSEYYDLGYTCKYFKGDSINSPDSDIIAGLQIIGIYKEMNGTLGVRDSRESIVSLAIIDYDRAEKIYDVLYEELKGMDRSSVDGKKGTFWSCYGKNSATGEQIDVSMSDQGYGYFLITVKKKIP